VRPPLMDLTEDEEKNLIAEARALGLV